MKNFDTLVEIMSPILKVPASAIDIGTKAEDMGAWDSLAHVNLMMTIEQTFDLMLDVEDFQKLVSVSAILEYLEEQGV